MRIHSMRLPQFLLLFGTAISLSGCFKELPICIMANPATYTIPEGGQSSSPNCVGLLSTPHLEFNARLETSTAYDADELRVPGNQVNKLFGFSDCGDSHSENGARFGWEMIDGKVQDMNAKPSDRKIVGGKMLIVPYVHLDGKITYDDKNPIAVVDLGQDYRYRIDGEDKLYRFTIQALGTPLRNLDGSAKTENSVTVTMPRACTAQLSLVRYHNLPYFGGQSAAPRQMNIHIDITN